MNSITRSRHWKMATFGFRAGPTHLRYHLLCQFIACIMILYIWIYWNEGILPKFLRAEEPTPIGPEIPLLEYFPNLKGDASKVTFACAANSQGQLEEAIKSDLTIIEGDVVLRGQGTGKQSLVPIMAARPKVTGDMTFDRWIKMAKHAGKAIKLDFQSIEAVEMTLQTLNEYKTEIQVPIWLSGEVLTGPNPPMDLIPLDSERFLRLCTHDFPQSTLVLGWNSGKYNPDSDNEYSWCMVKDMHDLVEKWNLLNRPLVFATKAVFVKHSISQMKWLLEMTGASLAVFQDENDQTSVDDLMSIYERFHISKVYFDLDTELQNEFDKHKEGIVKKTPIKPHNVFHSEEWTVMRGTSKGETYYMGNEAVLLQHGLLLSRSTYKGTSANPLTIQGTVSFLMPSVLKSGEDAPTDEIGVEIFLRVSNGARPSALSGIKFLISSKGSIEISSKSLPGVDSHRDVVWEGIPGTLDFLIEDMGSKKVRFTVRKPLDCKTPTAVDEQVLEMDTKDLTVEDGRLAIRASGNGFIAIPQFSVDQNNL